MAINSLAPSFVKIRYTVATIEHVMTLPVEIDGAITVGESPQLKRRAASSSDFVGNLTAFTEVLDSCFDDNCAFGTGEIWSQPTPADDPLWVYTYGLANTGESTTDYLRAEQVVMTFRSTLGGLFKLYLMETYFPPNQASGYSGMAAELKTLADYIMGESSWIKARDNGWPIACLGMKSKTNDVLRRKLLTG